MPSIHPYGASLNIKCYNSSKQGKTIDVYTDSYNYTLKEDYIGKGLSYFIESSVQPMTMFYECESINGDLVEIETNLDTPMILGGTNLNNITERKITRFGISNNNWFNKNPEQIEIPISKKINQVEIKLSYPYYSNCTFKKNNSSISYSTNSNLTNSIFRFDLTRVAVGDEIQATYNARDKKEEELIAYKYNNNFRINTTEIWLDNKIEVYKKDENSNISIINNNFNNKNLTLNNEQVVENEKLVVDYYINSEDTKEEFLPINNEDGEFYIQLSNVWVGIPQIYKALENKISSFTPVNNGTRISFNRNLVPEGTLLKVKYTNKNNEEKEEYLTAIYNSSFGYTVTVIFTKEVYNTNPKPEIFKIQVGDETINIKQNNNSQNKIIFLNENEIGDAKYAKVVYNYPFLKQEIVTVLNNNNIILSSFWIKDYFNETKVYKIIEINNFTSNSNNKYLEFSNDIISEGDIIFVKYDYVKRITNESHLAEESKSTTFYEGNISTISNNVIIKCLDLQNNIISYGVSNNNNTIFVNEKYDGQNIIVCYKEKPYINLCCNNVKVECGLRISDENYYNNFNSLQLYGSDQIIVTASGDNGENIYATLSRYITVHWNKSNNESVSLGVDKNTFFIFRKQIYLRTDGGYGETAERHMSFRDSPANGINTDFVIPPLNGKTIISQNSNMCYKDFYKLFYTIRPIGVDASHWSGGTKTYIENNYPIYKENGTIQFFSGTRQIITDDKDRPALYGIPIWGNEKTFYRTYDGYYISPASGGLLITGWDITKYSNSATSAGFSPWQGNYNSNYIIRTGPGKNYGAAQFIKTSNTVNVIGQQNDDEGNSWYCCEFQGKTETNESITVTGWVISAGIS